MSFNTIKILFWYLALSNITNFNLFTIFPNKKILQYTLLIIIKQILYAL